jgi:hypothetical protein
MLVTRRASPRLPALVPARSLPLCGEDVVTLSRSRLSLEFETASSSPSMRPVRFGLVFTGTSFNPAIAARQASVQGHGTPT